MSLIIFIFLKTRQNMTKTQIELIFAMYWHADWNDEIILTVIYWIQQRLSLTMECHCTSHAMMLSHVTADLVLHGPYTQYVSP